MESNRKDGASFSNQSPSPRGVREEYLQIVRGFLGDLRFRAKHSVKRFSVTPLQAEGLADALEDLLSSLGYGEGWRPIDTAPRDRAALLVCGRWDDGSPWWNIGHTNSLGLIYGDWEIGLEPTHWQPLPPPPVSPSPVVGISAEPSLSDLAETQATPIGSSEGGER